MSKENKNTTPNKPTKPKFSSWWIYGIIIVIFLAISSLGGGAGINEPKKTSLYEFKEYLRNGDIGKVEIVNKGLAKVYLTREAEANEQATKPNPTLLDKLPRPSKLPRLDKLTRLNKLTKPV